MHSSARSVLMVKPGTTLQTLLASYGFSEGSGTTTVDSSGHGHNLVLNSAAWAIGHTGNGLTNTTTGQGASVAFAGPTAAITMMAWVKPLDLPAGGTRVALGIFDSGGNTDVAIFTERGDFGTPNVLQCDVRVGSSLKAVYGPALTIGTWVHVAITFDGTTIRLYLNGSLYSSSVSSGVLRTGDLLTVAGTDPFNSYDSDVVVDDVRLFSSAQTAAQISLAMSTPVA